MNEAIDFLWYCLRIISLVWLFLILSYYLAKMVTTGILMAKYRFKKRYPDSED